MPPALKHPCPRRGRRLSYQPMVEIRKRLRPMAVLAALMVLAGALLCLASAMGNNQRLLGLGTLCLALGALAFLAWALSFTSELRRTVRELVAERPELGDGEFTARFFPEHQAAVETIARVRRMIAAKFGPLGGGSFWPEDRLAEDLHLQELAPADLADLPNALRRELRVPLDRWPPEAELGWLCLRDVYETALLAAEAGAAPASPLPPPDAPLQ